jgi:hypothetical protein
LSALSLFSGDLNTNVDFSDFIFVKIYSKFDGNAETIHKKAGANKSRLSCFCKEIGDAESSSSRINFCVASSRGISENLRPELNAIIASTAILRTKLVKNPTIYD